MDVLDEDELGSEFCAPSELHNEWKDKRCTRGEGQDGSVQAESRNFDESLTSLDLDGSKPSVYNPDSFQNGETEKKWRLAKELDENGSNDKSEEDAKTRRPSIPLVDLFSFTDKLEHSGEHSLDHTQKKDKPELIQEELAHHELVLEDKSMNFDDSPILNDEERSEPNVCDPPDGLQNGKKARKSVKWCRWRKASGENEHDDQPIKKASESKESTVSLLQLFSFADKLDYLLMFWGTVGATLHGAALPLVVLSFGQLLNRLGTRIDVERRVDQSALYFVWLSLVCLGSSWLEVSFWMHTGHRQAAKLRAMYLQALLQQDVGYFDTDTNTGDVVNSISTDPLALQDAISEKTGHFLHHMATFSASFIISFTSEWRIAIATLAIIPAIALPGGLYAFFLTRYNTRASSAYSEASRIVQEAISQVRTVYSFVAEEKFVKSYSAALERTLKLGVKGGVVKGLGTGATMSIFLVSYSVLLMYGGILVRQGKANGGAVLATFFNVIMGSTSLAQALSNLTPFGKARVSAFKIFQVIQHEPSINKPDKNSLTLETVNGQIQLRSVDFFYPSRPDIPIFQKFSLIIPPGKSVAIVGSSGSGKSTIVSLIERFYDPTSGEVLLDGVDLKKLDLRWLRRQIGLVNQEPALFATSIAANIAYGSDDASQEAIEEAATVANAHFFISQLPNGYLTEVGERGVQLSGGQRQRIAIARAVVKNPRVLLLDEATSALDARSEQVVQDALDKIMVGRTTVVVAHRLSTIRNADSIAVVEKGRIVEHGTHQDLISREDGAYSALVLLQELSTTRGAALDDTGFSSTYSPLSYSSRSPYGSVSNPSPHPSIISIDSVLDVCEATRKPKQQDEKLKGSKGSWKRLIVMTKEDWKHGITAIVGSIGAGCVGPMCGLLLGCVVSAYYDPDKEEMKRKISMLSLYFALLGISCIVFYFLQHYSLGVVGEKLINRVRQKLFANILRNEIGWFDEADNNSSQLASRLASDAATVRAAIGDRVSVLLQTVTLLIVSFSIAFVLQWKMTIVILAALPIIIFANVFEQWLLTKFAKDQAKAYERATRLAGEAVSNIRTVAAFNAEDKVQALFTNELEGPSKQSFRKGHAAGLGYGMSQGLMLSTHALSLWYAGTLVASGQSSFAGVIKVFLIVVISAYTAAEALTLAPDLVKGGQAVASLFQIIDRATNIEPDDQKGEKKDKIRGDIKLERVSMAYPSRPGVIVLKKMNLKVKSGRSLALVGASGSGKSSIVALIERFYDPISGTVLIDGKDIKQYNLQYLRQHIGLVQQEPALFANTIYENILYGKAEASEAEVVEAAKAANAHKFISALPDGYKTLVGERGLQLSGGQKQRVAIARAVLKDPTIFLLDEATSALDAGSEQVVQEAIDRLMSGRTTVIVAHRLSTIKGADSIAVLQDGKIAEQGSHRALLRKEGAYSQLIKLQRNAQ